MTRPTIAVIGAGQVGATTAHLALLKQLGDVVLVDVIDGLAEGKALDLLQAAAVEGVPIRVRGTTDYDAIAGAAIVVVTAGLARKPGMTRDDLLAANAGIVGPIADRIARVAPQAIVIVVTNPLDVMTQLVLKQTGFPRERVIGMAGVLDSGRLKAFIAEQANVSPADVSAMILGSHGDQMVPVVSSIPIGGKPATQRIDAATLEKLCERARNGGAEIVALLKQSSAYYAPAASVIQMVDAIVRNRRAVLPACVRLEGEYGLRDVCIGVPVELGSPGVVRVVEQPLTDAERTALHRAAQQVQSTWNQLLTLQPKA